MHGYVDIGHGHSIQFFQWAPDRELNPQYAAFPDVLRAGVTIKHQNLAPDASPGDLCTSAVNFDDPTMMAVSPGRTYWRLVSLEPLTVEPSVLCMRCGDHGYITDGRWVPA